MSRANSVTSPIQISQTRSSFSSLRFVLSIHSPLFFLHRSTGKTGRPDGAARSVCAIGPGITRAASTKPATLPKTYLRTPDTSRQQPRKRRRVNAFVSWCI